MQSILRGLAGYQGRSKIQNPDKTLSRALNKHKAIIAKKQK